MIGCCCAYTFARWEAVTLCGIFVCVVITFGMVGINQLLLPKPVRGQLSTKRVVRSIFPVSVCAWEFVLTTVFVGCPVPRQPAHYPHSTWTSFRDSIPNTPATLLCHQRCTKSRVSGGLDSFWLSGETKYMSASEENSHNFLIYKVSAAFFFS